MAEVTSERTVSKVLAGKTPCEKFACYSYAECKAQKMACKAFVKFTASGRVVRPVSSGEPSHERYLKMMGEM